MIEIFFIGSPLIALAIFLSPGQRIQEVVLSLYGILFGAFTVWAGFHIGETRFDYFRVDELAFIFLLVQAIITVAAIVHSIVYSRSREDERRITVTHHAALVLFLTVVAGVLVTTHAGALWGFLDASTLMASILIYHHRDALALEATWKYLFVASVGIALAFGGILFVAFAGQEAGFPSLFFEDIRSHAASLDTTWLKLSFVLIISGFSVKIGLVPLFSVDIDAKDITPSPVSALFSSVLMNAGFVAIFRFYESFSGGAFTLWMNHVLILTGVLSLIVATVYLNRVQNIKRILAYSSVEHAAIAMIALASGGVGPFAAVLHMVLHAFAKSSLFFQTGQIYRFFCTKKMTEYRGYLRLYPLGGLLFLLGFFCIVALPPGGLFFTELMTFAAFIKAGYVWIAVLCLILLLYILAVLSVGFFGLLLGRPVAKTISTTAPSRMEAFMQFALLGIVVVLGFYRPEFLDSMIHIAIRNLH